MIRPTRLSRLQAQGYVVARVDYLAARGMRGCQGASVGTSEIGQDVLAVAAHLRATPDVRAASIVDCGESLGGGGVLAALRGAEPGNPHSSTAPASTTRSARASLPGGRPCRC